MKWGSVVQEARTVLVHNSVQPDEAHRDRKTKKLRSGHQFVNFCPNPAVNKLLLFPIMFPKPEITLMSSAKKTTKEIISVMLRLWKDHRCFALDALSQVHP